MFVERFKENPAARAVLSVVLGLGLASLFRSTCKNGRCVVVEGPPVQEVRDNVYRLNGSCYKYTQTPSSCDDT